MLLGFAVAAGSRQLAPLQIQNLTTFRRQDPLRGFTGQAIGASVEFADRHTATLAELAPRDKQLQEHIDTSQRATKPSLELLTTRIAAFAESKQNEGQGKVDEMLSTM